MEKALSESSRVKPRVYIFQKATKQELEEHVRNERRKRTKLRDTCKIETKEIEDPVSDGGLVNLDFGLAE